jgi:hypothetical protein
MNKTPNHTDNVETNTSEEKINNFFDKLSNFLDKKYGNDQTKSNKILTEVVNKLSNKESINENLTDFDIKTVEKIMSKFNELDEKTQSKISFKFKGGHHAHEISSQKVERSGHVGKLNERRIHTSGNPEIHVR